MADFNNIASVRYGRSVQDLSHDVKTTLDAGNLVPLDVCEVLPGDSFKWKSGFLVRSTSPFITPVMDNIWMDVYHFFVPGRLCFDDFQSIFGVASPSSWIEEELATAPTLPAGNTASYGSIADYLGLAVGVKLPGGLSVLPFRAFALIYNTWFRNENVIDETLVQTGSISESEVLNSNPWSPNNYTGMPPKIGKKKDYFTSALPGQQKGEAVSVGSVGFQLNVPVTTTRPNNDPVGSHYPLVFNQSDKYSGSFLTQNWFNPVPFNSVVSPGAGLSGTNFFSSNLGAVTSTSNVDPSAYSGGVLGTAVGPTDTQFTSKGQGGVYLMYPQNLGINSEVNAPLGLTIPQLRDAWQFQKYLEKNARGGSRYNEFLLSHFGVVNPDARIQLPEYLGGGRFPIRIEQVNQTSATSDNGALGTVGAYSLSLGRSGFVKSFTEFGYIMTVGAIRTNHTYSQGIPRHFMRTSRFDFYDPLFANISEQPIYNNQLFVGPNDGNQADFRDNGIFGYNEAWADYRYMPNMLTCSMRPGIGGFALPSWSFGDVFASKPTLSQSFIEETPANVSRTLSFEASPQFIVDCAHTVKAARVLPVHSSPGYVDHH